MNLDIKLLQEKIITEAEVKNVRQAILWLAEKIEMNQYTLRGKVYGYRKFDICELKQIADILDCTMEQLLK